MAHRPYLLSICDTSSGLQRHDRARDFTRKQGHLIRSCALHATVIASVMDGTEPEKFNLTPCSSATITAKFKVHARVRDQNIWMPFFSGGHGPLGSPLFRTPWHAWVAGFCLDAGPDDIRRDFSLSFLIQAFPMLSQQGCWSVYAAAINWS